MVVNIYKCFGISEEKRLLLELRQESNKKEKRERLLLLVLRRLVVATVLWLHYVLSVLYFIFSQYII